MVWFSNYPDWSDISFINHKKMARFRATDGEKWLYPNDFCFGL